MYRYNYISFVHSAGKVERKAAALFLGIFAFALSFLPANTAFGQQPNKVQQAIDAIKAANYSEDQDYHTDGQRVVWVKSYKRWVPEDFTIMKKEAPDVLKFLGNAIQHNRYDVLEQLLPDYYSAHGGVKAFAADVIREQAEPQSK